MKCIALYKHIADCSTKIVGVVQYLHNVVLIYKGGATEVPWEQTEADFSGVGGTQEEPTRSDAQEQRIRRVSN